MEMVQRIGHGIGDNGSLPLNWLSVDGALLDFGACNVVIGHLGYFFDNYLKDDGTIDYYTWTGFR